MAKRSEIPDSFCPVPFTGMVFSQEGVVRCCRNRWTETLGTLKPGDDILKFWNSEKMMQWRQEFLDGNPQICKEQVEQRSCHLWNEHWLPHAKLARKLDNPPIVLSPLLNGQCNLECVMCDIWYKENGYYDGLKFWEQAREEIFPHIKFAEIYGGEPFIQKDTFRLIDEVSQVNPDCIWRFNTNGSWKFSKQMKQALDKINVEKIYFSVDSLDDEVFSKIRLKGKLSQVLQSMKEVLAYRDERAKQGRGFVVGIQPVAQIMNWREMPDFIEYADKEGMEAFMLYCSLPEEQSIDSLPPSERIRITDFFYNESKRLGSPQLKILAKTVFGSLSKKDKLACIVLNEKR